MTRALAVAGVLLAACGGKKAAEPTPKEKKDAGAGSAAAIDARPGTQRRFSITLVPAPPLPEVPIGLPALPDGALEGVTPELVALGEHLFYERALSASGKTACGSCHDPAHGFAGGATSTTDAGKPNLRRAPALVDLAWRTAFGWDGRYTSLVEHLRAHAKGQLAADLATTAAALDEGNDTYHAHFVRVQAPTGTDDPRADIAARALAAFVLTRYAGDAPWDRVERSADVPADLKAGYQLFTTKAQCATCHVPPLYTDLGFHRLGLIKTADEGRGRVDPAQQGAFATPSLRDAARRTAFFHDGSAPTLDAAIDWHLAGGTGQGADPSIIDKGLSKLALTATERAQLGAFVRALTSTAPAPTPAAPVPP